MEGLREDNTIFEQKKYTNIMNANIADLSNEELEYRISVGEEMIKTFSCSNCCKAVDDYTVFQQIQISPDFDLEIARRHNKKGILVLSTLIILCFGALSIFIFDHIQMLQDLQSLELVKENLQRQLTNISHAIEFCQTNINIYCHSPLATIDACDYWQKRLYNYQLHQYNITNSYQIIVSNITQKQHDATLTIVICVIITLSISIFLIAIVVILRDTKCLHIPIIYFDKTRKAYINWDIARCKSIMQEHNTVQQEGAVERICNDHISENNEDDEELEGEYIIV
jgi:hypothetical protein